jgi:hypothetical protein
MRLAALGWTAADRPLARYSAPDLDSERRKLLALPKGRSLSQPMQIQTPTAPANEWSSTIHYLLPALSVCNDLDCQFPWLVARPHVDPYPAEQQTLTHDRVKAREAEEISTI